MAMYNRDHAFDEELSNSESCMESDNVMSTEASKKLFQNNDVFHFSDISYAKNVVANFHQQRLEGRFLDVTLKAGDSKILGHRSFLAAFATYFGTLFTWGGVEPKMEEVVMKDVDGVALGLIVDFAYSGKLDIMSSNVVSLLETANYIGVDLVKNACRRYLLQRLNVDNATDVMTLGSMYGCSELYDKAKLFAVEHFEQLSESPTFLELDPKVLCDLVSDERLVFTEEGFCVDSARQEWHVLESVLRYAKHDEESRIEPLASYLLSAVRLFLITPELTTITRESLAEFPRLTRALNVAFEQNVRLPPRSISGLAFHLERKRLADSMALRNEGSAGAHDDTNEPLTRYVTGMKIYIRTWDDRPVVGGIHLEYSSGQVVQLGQDSFPGESNVYSFQLEANERIVGATIRAGWMLDALTFVTNRNNRFGPYGGTGGNEYVYNYSNNESCYLAGVQCRVDIAEQVSCIRHFKLVWAKFKYSTVCDKPS